MKRDVLHTLNNYFLPSTHHFFADLLWKSCCSITEDESNSEQGARQSPHRSPKLPNMIILPCFPKCIMFHCPMEGAMAGICTITDILYPSHPHLSFIQTLCLSIRLHPVPLTVCVNKLIRLRSLWAAIQALALREAFIAINHFIRMLVENQANTYKITPKSELSEL